MLSTRQTGPRAGRQQTMRDVTDQQSHAPRGATGRSRHPHLVTSKSNKYHNDTATDAHRAPSLLPLWPPNCMGLQERC